MLFGKTVNNRTSYVGIMASLRYVGLQLCTCTWSNHDVYWDNSVPLLLHHSYMLATLTLAVFAPLIGFHFVMTKISKLEECNSLKCSKSFHFSEKTTMKHQ